MSCRFLIPTSLLSTLLIFGCEAGGPTEPQSDSELSEVAEDYLNTVLDIMQANSIKRYEIDWPEFRTRVTDSAGAARQTQETYDAIRFAIELIGDNHSFFQPPTSVSPAMEMMPLQVIPPSAKHLGWGIGYVDVPAFGAGYEEANALASEYHRLIQGVDTLGVCAWIVDLRGNTGGNMWPMLAGIGPIVGEGILGFFVDPDSIVRTWSYEDGSSRLDGSVLAVAENPYELASPYPPVAVLTNRLTASSGEATAIAFRGRVGASSIGDPTWGVPTANQAFPLSDGARLILTVSYMADRTGRQYGDKLQPDHRVQVGISKHPDPQIDAGVTWAVDWSRDQPECAGFLPPGF